MHEKSLAPTLNKHTPVFSPSFFARPRPLHSSYSVYTIPGIWYVFFVYLTLLLLFLFRDFSLSLYPSVSVSVSVSLASHRVVGDFYLFLDVTNMCGRPVLVALVPGEQVRGYPHMHIHPPRPAKKCPKYLSSTDFVTLFRGDG